MEKRSVEDIREEFVRIFKENIKRDGAEKLLEYLLSSRSDFFTAPASTRFHYAFPGGLALHSLNVYHCLKAYMERERVRSEYALNASDETIAVIALLHDLCKINFYKTEKKNQKTYDAEKIAAAEHWQVKTESGGRQFIWEEVDSYTIDEEFPYGHGEKSVYIINGYIRLTREEAIAIRYHMGFSDVSLGIQTSNVGKAFESYPLAFALSVADMEATYFIENESRKDIK